MQELEQVRAALGVLRRDVGLLEGILDEVVELMDARSRVHDQLPAPEADRVPGLPALDLRHERDDLEHPTHQAGHQAATLEHLRRSEVE